MTEAQIAADAAMRTAIIGVAGAFLVALVGIGGTLLNVKLNADRERERIAHDDRVRQSEAARAAARQILRHVEEVARLYRKGEDGETTEVPPVEEREPHIFAIQGLIEEVPDKKARDVVLHVADMLYIPWPFIEEWDWQWGQVAYRCREAVRQVLGAFLRGEAIPDPPKIAEMYAHHQDVMARVDLDDD